MDAVRPLAALLVAVSGAAAARAQPVVNAGADQRTLGTAPVKLQGSVTNLTPLDYWTADGDHSTEDCLLKYDDSTGVTAIGPLQTASGTIYGWPSDFERIGGVVYGIETFDRRLYTLDPATAICTPVGAQVGFTRVFGLSYDPAADKLYGVDQSSRKILLFNRSTGDASVVRTLDAQYSDVRGIAWRQQDQKLYFTDDATETLNRIDLATGVVELLIDLNDGPDAKVDEIEFFHGRLLALFRVFDARASLWSAQLFQVDLDDPGNSMAWGPLLVDLSAHSLLVNALPERVYWTQASGPGQAVFSDRSDPQATVSFTLPGRYVLELHADGPAAHVTDRVRVESLAPHRPAASPRKLR